MKSLVLCLATLGLVSGFPCPSSDSILPCTCFHNTTTNELFLNCDSVETDLELETVFEASFPVTKFSKLKLHDSSSMVNLNFSTNGVSFEEMEFSPGHFQIETISDKFLFASKDTLRVFQLINSEPLLEFPFPAIDEYPQLEEIRILKSSITSLPKFYSDNFKTLYLTYSSVSGLDSTTFRNSPNLVNIELFFNDLISIPEQSIPVTTGTKIDLSFNQLTEIQSGAFYETSRNVIIPELLLHGNNLTHLTANSIPISPGTKEINLSRNQIQTVDVDMFQIIGEPDLDSTRLYLTENQLIHIDEAVFGPVMPYVSYFEIEDNPLTCGCDVAWLVLNQALMNKVSENTTCASGTNIHSLSVDLFEDFC